MNIIELIPVGKENAINRAYLLTLCKTYGIARSDREMRKQIENARRTVCILNLSDNRGYFRPTMDDLPELKHYIAQEYKRSMTILVNLKTAHKTLDDFEGVEALEF